MKQLTLVAAVLLAPISFACGQNTVANPAARDAGEAAPTFSARSLLDQSILQGVNYRIDDRVDVKDYRYLFQIRTENGTFPASGLYLLEKRLRELQAIEKARQMSGDPVILESAWGAIRKTPQGASTFLHDPLGSVLEAPRGFGQIASSVVNPLDRRAGSPRRTHL